ncbi:unnamed protein product [Oppiella nova]|uniref:UBC core domain-containing protein n=1 Tax=Oppiella nova TaxID=334625 RepID=A0A7R9MBA1_9ACAR|nr:unnamed protein product [Oppiella nova]CAG2174226.1 unnamed protein product [Oppiella nova]
MSRNPPIELSVGPVADDLFHWQGVLHGPRRQSIRRRALQKQWSSAYTLTQAMLSISSLLTDPNTSSPLNPMSARLYESDRKKYNSTVRQWIRMYASAEVLDN